jgi:O-antigen/teichoic acid export membrane protein
MLQVMYAIGLYADPLILTTLLGPSAVAIYRAATVLPMRIQPLVNLADHLQPFATRYYVGAQTAKLQETLIKGTRYTLLLGILPCVILGVFADSIAHIWLGRALGDDYRTVATVLRAWVIVELIGSAGGAHWSVFQAVNKLRFLAWTQVPFAVLNVGLSCVLVAWTSVGVVGVVLGTIAAAVIRRPMLIVAAARACGLSVRTYAREAYGRPLLVLLVLAGIAFCCCGLEFLGTVQALVVGVAVTAAAWAPLTWWLGFTGEDRQTVGAFFGQAVRALRFRGALGVDSPAQRTP